MSLFVGIDISKNTFDVAIHETTRHRKFPNTAAGVEALDAWLQQQGTVKLGWKRPGVTGKPSHAIWSNAAMRLVT